VEELVLQRAYRPRVPSRAGGLDHVPITCGRPQDGATSSSSRSWRARPARAMLPPQRLLLAEPVGVRADSPAGSRGLQGGGPCHYGGTASDWGPALMRLRVVGSPRSTVRLGRQLLAPG
jgi:hypothetical protein